MTCSFRELLFCTNRSYWGRERNSEIVQNIVVLVKSDENDVSIFSTGCFYDVDHSNFDFSRRCRSQNDNLPRGLPSLPDNWHTPMKKILFEDHIPPLPEYRRLSSWRFFPLPLVPLCACLALLIAPALWNGYPLVFYDTGGYVEAALRRCLIPGRSLFYGLFLQLLSFNWISFWGVIVIQAGSILWIIHLVWRCHRLPAGSSTLLPVTAFLAFSTGLPWYAAQLMPDVFVPLMVLALWLLAAHVQALRLWEIIVLSLIVLLATFTHMSCLALALGLVGVLLIQRALAATWLIKLRILLPTSLVLAVLLLMPPLHTLLTGSAGYTPGGSAFLFGSLVQNGLVKHWLHANCPVPGMQMCEWKDALPETADEFLWAKDSPYKMIGGWKDPVLQQELGQLVWATVQAYPVMAIDKAFRATLQQLVDVATGDGLQDPHWDTRGIISTFLPRIAPAFNAARQQQEEITPWLLAGWNRLHIPVALACLALLLPILYWGVRTRRDSITGITLFVLVALLGNAFICGALSNPHDRYQSRLIWLAPLVVLLALTEYRCPKSPPATLSQGAPMGIKGGAPRPCPSPFSDSARKRT